MRLRVGGTTLSAGEHVSLDALRWAHADSVDDPPRHPRFGGEVWLTYGSWPVGRSGVWAVWRRARRDDERERFRDVDDAIEWARKRAEVVTVTEGELGARRRYAAGRHQAHGEKLPRLRAAEEGDDVRWRVSAGTRSATVEAPTRRVAVERAVPTVIGQEGAWTAVIEAEPLDT